MHHECLNESVRSGMCSKSIETAVFIKKELKMVADREWEPGLRQHFAGEKKKN